jgi:beta-N-acetylhexosaminidase
MELSKLCGQLVVGGFSGTRLSPSFERALRAGERGGAILFKRNLGLEEVRLEEVLALTAAIRDASDEPPIVAVDQEGGRVARFGAPALRVPPMRRLAAIGDPELTRRVARAQANELAALGFSTGFAPVLDVDTHPDNPVIGDRSFARDAETVARYATAAAAGMREGGIFACGKHFPGHGDTREDSHFARPLVDRPRAELERIEVAPFRALARAGIEAMMTAHVVFTALDPEQPATLSHAICTDLLRRELGFEGVLFSDDLEMKALRQDRGGVEETAVGAIRAGCDLLLVCSDESLQASAHEALVREAERVPAFLARCREAHARALRLRRAFPPRPVAGRAALDAVFASSASVAGELAARGAWAV